MNRQSAKEWLNKGWHHLSSEKILYEANHYTDTIAVDLHYAIEVILKSFFAYENKKILLDRQQLLKIMKKQTLDSSDSLWLKEKTTYYKIKSTKFNDLVLAELLKRIDIIPVEVVLAQAAIESNWGTSAFATKYNNLFGTRTSSKKNGIIPKKRAKSETYRVAAYRTVNESIRSYLRNINTHKAYAEFRNNRAKLRMHNKPLDGLLLADYLTAYSTFGTEYVQRIKSLMRNHQKMFNKKIDMENL